MVETLSTRRLRLRPIRRRDAAALAALLEGDAEAISMTERLPDPCTEAAARAWIAQRQAPGQQVFAVELRDEAVFLGCAGLFRSGRDSALGYLIGRPYWNRGYATEAGRALLEAARRSGTRELLGEAFVENAASKRVLQKLGFVPIRRIEKNLPERGGLRHTLRFRLTL